MKTYTIPEFGITVTVDGGAGTIESDLKRHMIGDDGYEMIEDQVLALESLILGHACAGIDVAAPAYVQGLRSSLEATGKIPDSWPTCSFTT